MGKTREIKKRIKAVGNIRRITKTMQMIATSKFAASNARALASKPYTTAMFDLVNELTAALSDVTHPLVESGKAKRPGAELTLVLTSDRGLCGPYNGSVLRTALAYLREHGGAKGGLIELVGKKGVSFLRFNKIPVARHHTQFADKITYEKVEALAREYIDRFTAGEVSAVRVVSMRFISAGRQRAEVQQLLPFKPKAVVGAVHDSVLGPSGRGGAATPPKFRLIYEFSPAAGELLDDLLPAAVKATLFQLFQEASVSEHVARMIAMKAATDNAGKAGKRLNRTYNRARQSQITTELTEIISGAAALA